MLVQIILCLSLILLAESNAEDVYMELDDGLKIIGVGALNITFDGDRLKFLINSDKPWVTQWLCIGPASTHDDECGSGLALLRIDKSEGTPQLFEIDRSGNLWSGSTSKPAPSLSSTFVTIEVKHLPVGMTITLKNAQIYVLPPEPEDESDDKDVEEVTEKDKPKALNAGIIAIIACAGIFAVVAIVVAAIVLWRRCRKKKADVEKQKVPKSQEAPKEPSKSKAVIVEQKDETAPPPPPPSQAPSIDKKSAEPPSIEPKQQDPTPSKPVEANPKTATIEQSKETTVVANVSVQKKPPTVTEQSLREDSTQRATGESIISNPTPKFGETAAAKALASNSKFVEKQSVPFSQAPRRYGKKFNIKKADEMDSYALQLESQVMFAERNELITKHDIFLLKERYTPCEHEVSDLEKLVLKGTPKTAVEAADDLIIYSDKALKNVGFDPAMEMQQPITVWQHLKSKLTPATEVYWVLIHALPNIVAIHRQSPSDPFVRYMPLPGLYMLIIDPRLKRRFREQCVHELRHRSSLILPNIQMDSLRNAAFPSNYLARLYFKNPRSYVEGKSVKSKSRMSVQ
uniref:Bulb-type lectin domain-containing protein n=1 Tax=Panagrellus redivivus TaxID=6233 RepID=A0A7E4V6V6_PANRE